jgi:hypothetical protein
MFVEIICIIESSVANDVLGRQTPVCWGVCLPNIHYAGLNRLVFMNDVVRNGYTTLNAINPANGKEWPVWLSLDKQKQTAKRGMGAALELGRNVLFGLVTPVGIYGGIREEEGSGFCYVSRPPHRYAGWNGTQVAANPNEVFCVFVSKDRVVLSWSWIVAERDEPNAPEGCAERFTDGRLL